MVYKTCNVKIMSQSECYQRINEHVTTHLSSNLSAQEYSREPGAAKTDVAKLMSFYDFLNACLTHTMICSIQKQILRR